MPRDSGLRSFLAWLLGERVFEYTMSLCEHGSCRNPPWGAQLTPRETCMPLRSRTGGDG